MRMILYFIVLNFINTSAQSQTQYPLRQYLSIRAAGFPSISPDGSQVAFRTSITGTSQVWRISSKSGWPDQLTFFPSSVSTVSWSPAGDTILVTADNNGDEQFQFYIVRPDGTSISALTKNPKVRHGFGGWSADGSTIYYSSNARNPQFFDCYLMDVKSGKDRLVFQKDSMLSVSAMSHDGRWLAAVEMRSNTDSDLYLVDTTTANAKQIAPHTGEAVYNAIDFSPDGGKLYVVTDQDREFHNLASVDTATGKLTYIHKVGADVEKAEITPDGRRLAYVVNRDGYQDLEILDLRTLKSQKLPPMPHGSVTLGNFTGDSRRLALGINTPARANDIWILDLPAARMSQITFSSMAGIDSSTFMEPAFVNYKTFDGKMIPAFLLMPKNTSNGTKLPVILSVHGGPEGQERPVFNPINQYLVSRGYAVLSPNIRGSTGYGKTYMTLDNGPRRWDALKDLAAAVEWIGTQPGLDKSKVAIMGGSYGGFAVLAMLAHYPTLFSAGVDMFGPADFKTFLANTASYRRSLRAAEYGDPEKDSDFLDAISPMRHVDRIKAPLLVLQGANDPRVPESESRQVYEKVKAKGGVTEYILFPDEGHGFAKLPNRIKAYEAVVAFLDKNLRGSH